MKTLLVSLGFVTGLASAYGANAYLDYKYPLPPCQRQTLGDGPMLYAQHRSYTHVDPSGRISIMRVVPKAGNTGGIYYILDSDGRAKHGSFSQYPPSSTLIPPPIDMGPTR